MVEPAFRAHVRRAVQLAGSQHKLARHAGERGYPISQQLISQLLNELHEISARASLSIHAATEGAVPASMTRPDLWRRPEDVPIELNGARPRRRRKRNGARR